MQNIKFLIVLIGLIGWQSVTAQSVGVGVETPQTALHVKNKMVVRDIKQFDSSKKLWGLYIANKDFDLNGRKIKKGQVVKAQFTGARKMYTYELFLKCGSNGDYWYTDIDYYVLGIDPTQYTVILTESALYSLQGDNKKVNEIIKENTVAKMAHADADNNGSSVRIDPNQINGLKNVYLYKSYVSGSQNKQNPQWLLHASFSREYQNSFNAYNREKEYNPKGFYWRFKFLVVDNTLITQIKTSADANGNRFHAYTVNNSMKMKGTATDAVNNELEKNRVKNRYNRPSTTTLAKLFKDYPPNLKSAINLGSEEPTAILDVNGNLSITEIDNKRTTLYHLANLFVDEEGHLYSFTPSEIEQKELALVEGYINTRGTATRQVGESGNFKMSAPSRSSYPLMVGTEALVGDFDLRIPYNEYIVMPISSNFGNYEQKRRWVQQLRDHQGEFGASTQNRNSTFKVNNWYTNYALYGYKAREVVDESAQQTGIVVDDNGNTGSTRWWSYLFGLGHYIAGTNMYNSQKVVRVFSAPSFDQNESTGVFKSLGERITWHLRLDYPESQPMFGLAAIASGVWFQPQTFKLYQDQFYWKYNVLAFSRTIIQDLGRMYDSMDYYRDYYAKYASVTGTGGKGGVKQGLGKRSVNPAVYQPVFIGQTLEFLRYVNGNFEKNDRDIVVPIVPTNGYHPNGYIEDFKINLPVEGSIYQSNKPVGLHEQAIFYDNTNDDLYIE